MTTREYGVLFRPGMVRALLANRKRETRRPIACSNSLVNGDPFPRRLWPGLRFERAWIDPGPSPAGNAGPYLKVPFRLEPDFPEREGLIYRVYPRIDVGDRIWVRETWRGWNATHISGDEHRVDIDYLADGQRRSLTVNSAQRLQARVVGQIDVGLTRDPLRPGIHMPRWAARIELAITEKTIPQQIGTLTEEQKIAEGFPLPDSDPEGPATFDEYIARIHEDLDPKQWFWGYRGLETKEAPP